MKLEDPEGATPLDLDETKGLIPTHITTMEQLNEWEQANILDAEEWAFSARKRDPFTEQYVRDLHRHMFNSTWAWAGKYRLSDKNIGVPWTMIPQAVRDVCDDAKAWIEFDSHAEVEIAVRLHLRMVQVHPFPNGNGRHARLLADVVIERLGKPRLTWGNADLQSSGNARITYLNALRAADGGVIRPLLDFAAS